ncbi:MAG: CBS domain-containing protein [Dethiobacteria bacterium]|jgi:CBS domain-containing protein
MSKALRFLAAYNRIDACLREIAGSCHSRGFSSLVKKTAGLNRIVAKHRKDLLMVARLRNVLVHEQKKPNYIIAEPHQDIVNLVEEIANALEKPPLVIPTFRQKVVTFTDTELISKPLIFIKENNYSQFPIYDGESHLMGLLTERCIARWLASQVKVGEEMMLIEETCIGRVLEYKENSNNLSFLPENATVYEAEDLFLKNRSLEAILITEDKDPNAPLLGIITLWDIFSINK